MSLKIKGTQEPRCNDHGFKAFQIQNVACTTLPLGSKDIIVMLRDTGLRNARELYPLRLEHIHWHNRLIFG